MWGNNEASFTAGGGGFLPNTESPAGGDKQGKGRRSQNIMPVTCKQLLECPEDNFKLEGFEAHVITIVGIVRKVDTTTTKMSMWIDDHTGTIECIHYVGNEQDNSEAIALCENAYGRVVGALRTMKGVKYIIIFKTSPVIDLNEVTCHLMEVIQNGLKLKKLRINEEQKSAFGKPMDNSFNNSMIAGNLGGPSGAAAGGGGGAGNRPNFNRNQNIILDLLSAAANSETGVHRDEIFAKVQGRMSRKEANDTLEFLSNEGHVFSTIDEDHYSSTS